MTRLIPTLALVVGTSLGCLALPASAPAAVPPGRTVVVTKVVKPRYHRRHHRRVIRVGPRRPYVHRHFYYWRRHHRVWR